jgi:hypothetical protein
MQRRLWIWWTLLLTGCGGAAANGGAPEMQHDLGSGQTVSSEPAGEILDMCVPPPSIPGPQAAAGKSQTWGSGYKLRIAFIGGSQDEIEHVKSIASEWMVYANITFEYPPLSSNPMPEIRISFNRARGASSFVGRQALKLRDRYTPTMNLGPLAYAKDEQHYRRTVLHEFGHALGLIHEHQSPAANFQWDMKMLMKTYGPRTAHKWSEDDIQHQIVDKVREDSTNHTKYDPKSIMLYYIDPRCLKSGSPNMEENFELSDLDKQFIGSLYPSNP